MTEFTAPPRRHLAKVAIASVTDSAASNIHKLQVCSKLSFSCRSTSSSRFSQQHTLSSSLTPDIQTDLIQTRILSLSPATFCDCNLLNSSEFVFLSVAYLLQNVASYDGEILHTDACRPLCRTCAGFYVYRGRRYENNDIFF